MSSSNKDNVAPARSTRLLSLPSELLSTIAGELPLDDLLQVRVACRALNKACGTRQVWRQLFSNSLGVSIPKPFFLGKLLEECSSRELEHALRRWEAPWLPASPVVAIQREVAPGPPEGHQFFGPTAVLAPGGRWSLICCEDGSVWYFDLSQDWTSTESLEPRLLIPALPPPSGVPENVLKSAKMYPEISVDWTSPEALGASANTHLLTQFNVAVLISWDVRNDPVRFNIWNVQVKDGLHGPELTLGEHLSAFTEDGFFELTPVCLYGPSLAYSRYRSSTVYLVDWREVNGRCMKEPLPGRRVRTGGSVPSSSVVESIHLLPGSRILLISKCNVSGNALFTLHNWESDCPQSNISGSHALLATTSRPLWEFKSPYPTTPFTAQYPLIIRDTTRMVLPTRYMLYGLAVKMDDYTLEGIKMAPLVQGPFTKRALPTQAFQFNRAVGIRRGQGDMFYAQYSWDGTRSEGPDSSTFLRIDDPLHHRLTHVEEDLRGVPGSCLFDQFSNRVVVTNFDTTRFFTIFSTRFTSVGETFSVDDVVSTQEDSDFDESHDESSDGASVTSEGETPPEDALDRMKDLAPGGGHSDDASAGGSDHTSVGGYSDDELSWKGIGSLGDISDEESGAESHHEEPVAKQGLDATGAEYRYSDDEISWKGVGAAGDCSEEELAGSRDRAERDKENLEEEAGEESESGDT